LALRIGSDDNIALMDNVASQSEIPYLEIPGVPKRFTPDVLAPALQKVLFKAEDNAINECVTT
jgi:hypothetical protein